MSARRLLELWEPPPGFRLASLLATTYELQPDFLEEDLLPVALGLGLPPARGGEFRGELDLALQPVEATVFFHPDGYHAGLRRSPRIDLKPLSGSRFPKLHAKLALLRFVDPQRPEPARQVVRLVIGSANLTAPGYRDNLEVAAALDDRPGADPEVVTAVRDAAAWLAELLGPAGAPSEAADHRLRDLRAVFAARPGEARRGGLAFVGLPARGGLLAALPPADGSAEALTIASPFWPAGEDPGDVARALARASGGRLGEVRLIGPACPGPDGEARPLLPASLLRALGEAGARVWVAAADPRHGTTAGEGEEPEDEFGEVARRRSAAPANRALHAKLLLFRGRRRLRLAMGSFNLTRRGLGLTANANAEAGLVFDLPARRAHEVEPLFGFAAGWRAVRPAEPPPVIEPAPRREDPAEAAAWPDFLLEIRAGGGQLEIKGDGRAWPPLVSIRLRETGIRPRGGEGDGFGVWEVPRPGGAAAVFTIRHHLPDSLSPLACLEVLIGWDGHEVAVPVLFTDKHLLPVAGGTMARDEAALLDWFLGLRGADGGEEPGLTAAAEAGEPPADETPFAPRPPILSYLVRDFVHALPGIEQRIREAGLTESGLKAALLGLFSPVELARRVQRAFLRPGPEGPVKTLTATLFQLEELRRLLARVTLPELPGDAGESLRAQALGEVAALLAEVRGKLPRGRASQVLRSYLDEEAGKT